jgi:hypothetical protein
MLVKGVVGAPFHKVTLPHINARALFHPNTAHGKLNAEITPTIPN